MCPSCPSHARLFIKHSVPAFLMQTMAEPQVSERWCEWPFSCGTRHCLYYQSPLGPGTQVSSMVAPSLSPSVTPGTPSWSLCPGLGTRLSHLAAELLHHSPECGQAWGEAVCKASAWHTRLGRWFCIYPIKMSALEAAHTPHAQRTEKVTHLQVCTQQYCSFELFRLGQKSHY